MEISYDKKNEIFLLNNNQVYWSSIYLLDRSKIGFKIDEITKDLELDDVGCELIKGELHDLERFGLVNSKHGWAVITKKGNDFLKRVSDIVPLENLKNEAMSDLNGTRDQISDVGDLIEKEEIFCPQCGKTYKKSLLGCPYCNEANPYESFPLMNYILNLFLAYVAIVVLLLFFSSVLLVLDNRLYVLSTIWPIGLIYIVASLISIPIGGIITYLFYLLGRSIRRKLFGE
ncbi:MAG: hypothetical protein KAR20_13565 [Candidatus Heimdallarchaeota archaeon]|nr:hypothetical protein [Candidatus Heimdallarchaeota archaeon]